MFTNQLTFLAPPRHVLGAAVTATRVQGPCLRIFHQLPLADSVGVLAISTETSLVFEMARTPVVRHYPSGREYKADVVGRLIEVKSLWRFPATLAPVHNTQERGVRSPW